MHQGRTVIQKDFKNGLQEVDLLLSPVTPTAADKIGTAPFCSILHFNLLLSSYQKFKIVVNAEGFQRPPCKKMSGCPLDCKALTNCLDVSYCRRAIRLGLGDARLDSFISNFSNPLVYHIHSSSNWGFY
jgi:hypothetical protein